LGIGSACKFGLGAGIAAAALAGFAAAQMPVVLGTPLVSNGSSPNSSQPNSATGMVRTVQGRVVNALDGAAIARALVSLNNRSVLTDSEGRFAFPDFTDQQASARVTKPGFNQSASGGGMGNPNQRITNLDAPLELKLYPDAIISGTLTDVEGTPLDRVQVTLLRQMLLPDGLRWQQIHGAQTNLHGEFRFREPGGRFRLSVNYSVRGDIVLPLTYPGHSSGDGLDYFEVPSGQEKQVDLRARTSPGYPVAVRVEPSDVRGMQFTAVTANGESFPVMMTGQSQGAFLVSLPTGSFTLRGRMNDRETSMEGSTRVTVTGPKSDPAVLHLEAAASLPIELSVDPASTTTTGTPSGIATSSQSPTVQQFNLRLHRLDDSSTMNQDIPARMGEDKVQAFQVSPGHYRLIANGGGAWYIESATYGVTNAMTSDIAIGSGGGGGTPIRIVVNNAKGKITGTVRFPTSSAAPPDMVWVYMIPRGPSLGPLNPNVLGNSGAASTTFSMTVPPGSYLAVAMDHQALVDLRDPEVLAKFSTAAKAVEVTTSATATVDLEIAPEPAK
jgi:Carboxypeptidase regulatory-like domain